MQRNNCLPHAVQGSVFGALLLSIGFFVCVWNTLGTSERICAKFTRKACLVRRSDVFEGQSHRLGSPVTKKRHFRRPAWGLFGKTSLASKFLLSHSLFEGNNTTSIRKTRSAFHKIVRWHFSGVVNKFTTIYVKFLQYYMYQNWNQFTFDSVIKKVKSWQFLDHNICMCSQTVVYYCLTVRTYTVVYVLWCHHIHSRRF